MLGDTGINNDKLITLFSIVSSETERVVDAEFITFTPDTLVKVVIIDIDTISDSPVPGETEYVVVYRNDTTFFPREDRYHFQITYQNAPVLKIEKGTKERPLWALPIPQNIPTGYFVENVGSEALDFEIKLSRGIDTLTIFEFLDPGESREIVIPLHFSVPGWHDDPVKNQIQNAVWLGLEVR